MISIYTKTITQLFSCNIIKKIPTTLLSMKIESNNENQTQLYAIQI